MCPQCRGQVHGGLRGGGLAGGRAKEERDELTEDRHRPLPQPRWDFAVAASETPTGGGRRAVFLLGTGSWEPRGTAPSFSEPLGSILFKTLNVLTTCEVFSVLSENYIHHNLDVLKGGLKD